MKTSKSDPAPITAGEFAIAAPSPKRMAELHREEREAEQRRRSERTADLWKGARVPERHAAAVTGLPTAGPWADASSELSGLIGSGFLCVLMGKRGTGKTQMAVKAIRQACELQRSSAYVKAMQIFLDIRDSFGNERSEKASVGRYTAPQLLVIDAMEERGETPFEDRILNHIIDIRYDSLKDTILVTNQTAEAFSESSGPSILSRIHETGKKIECDWPSFRTPKTEGAEA